MDVEAIAAAVEERNPRGIAAAVSHLIRSGELPAGSRLPTVRELAASLQVSPATVSHAWQALAGAGLILVRGRAGTTVLKPSAPWLAPRSLNLASLPPEASAPATWLDLSSGIPDPTLLPRLGPAFARVVPPTAATSHYFQPPQLAELEAPLRASWPYPPPSLAIVDGVMDGIQRALMLTTRYGDRVLVESPGFPILLDLLAHLHLVEVGVRMDGEGLVPEALNRALGTRPAALVLQPRANNPTGISMSPARAEQLAGILARHRHGPDTVVIEDDHSSGIASTPLVSLGTWLPRRTIHVRGFSKSHGPDLRIAALSGPSGAVDQVVARRMLGPGWTSRMLQAVLGYLLTDREAIAQVQTARRTYLARQHLLATELSGLGLASRRADGLNLWLPVPEEREAQVQLAAHGVRVALGSAFQLPTTRHGEEADWQQDPLARPHVRVSVGLLRGHIPEVAALLAGVARSDP